MNSISTSVLSPIHSLEVRTKFFGLLFLIPLCAFISSGYVSIFILLIVCLLIYLSKIPIRKFLALVIPYTVILAISLIFLSLAFSDGSVQNRLYIAMDLILKFSVVIIAGVLFSEVTNPNELPIGFLRFGLPHKLGISLMVALRMLPIIQDKISIIIDAQRARGVNLIWSISEIFTLPRNIMALFIPVIYSTLEVSVNLADTMLTRGYDPNRKITIPPGGLGLMDILFLIFCIALLVVSFFIEIPPR